MENYEREEEKISRINSAGLVNATLENLWKESYTCIKKGDYITWNRILDSIWLILGGDVEENGKEDKIKTEIDLKIYSFGSLSHKKEGFRLLDDKDKENMSNQYIYLMKKALFLRRLQNKQGKGTAYASDDDDDFD